MAKILTETGWKDLQEINPGKQGRDAAKDEDRLFDIVDELRALTSQMNTYVPADPAGRNKAVANLDKNKRAIEGIGKDIQKWAKKI